MHFRLASPLQWIEVTGSMRIGLVRGGTLGLRGTWVWAAVLVFSSTAVYADQLGEHPATHIDFNKMIDESGTNKTELHDSISAPEQPVSTTSKTSTGEHQDEQKKVLDFVDLELGLSADRPIVDRRVNSVSTPRVVDANEFAVQLLRVKNAGDEN